MIMAFYESTKMQATVTVGVTKLAESLQSPQYRPNIKVATKYLSNTARTHKLIHDRNEHYKKAAVISSRRRLLKQHTSKRTM